MKKPLAILIAAGLCAAQAFAGDVKETARFALAPVPSMAAPNIDGVVGKGEWLGATLMPRLINASDGCISAQRSRVYIGSDDANLYVAFQFDRPPNALVPTEADTCTLLLDPAHAHQKAATFSGNINQITAGEGWTYKAHATDFGWEGEMAIPFSALKRAAPADGEVWGIDIVNHQMAPIEDTSALSYTNNRASTRDFTHIVFSKSSPAVRFRELGMFNDENGGGASLELVNLHQASVAPVVSLELFRRKSGTAGGPATFLKGIGQALATDNSDLVLPAADLDAMIAEHLARYAPVTEASGKAESTAALAAQQRSEFRVTQTEPGDYLCRYQVKSGDRILAAGIAPFAVAAPLAVTAKPFFLSPKVLEVTADLRRVPEWVAGAKLRFAIAHKAGELPLVTSERSFADATVVVEQMPTAKLTAGGYELTAELVGADGQRKAILSEGFNKAADPDWFTHPVAATPAVPPPWTPIEVNPARVSFLMGDYELGTHVWPQQINVRSVYSEKRLPILRAPMSIEGRVNGKELSWNREVQATRKPRPELFEVEGTQDSEDLSIRTVVSFEYDGMAKVSLDLVPRNGTKPAIDALWLDVPLTPEVSKLFNYAPTVNGMKGPRQAGALRPDDALKFEFIASIWIGDEERGFRWFAENWKGWHFDKEFAGETIEVINSPQGATLRVNFVKVAKPFMLEQPRHITFGYEFTPPKTLPNRLFFESFYPKGPSNTPGDAQFTAMLAAEHSAGVNVVEHWYYKWQGWPEVYSDQERSEKLSSIGYAHNAGIAVVPYSGWYIARDSDTYKAWGAEMLSEPVANAGCGCDQCCWNTAVTDAYPTLLADRARDTDIDGYRMDAGFSAENCRSLVHRGYGSECGWFDDDGKLQPSRPIFAARKASQRAYRVFHGEVKENGWCLHHIHQGNRYDAILSHQDAVVSAEGPELAMKSLADMPLDFYRAFVMGDAHGYRVIYLPKSQKLGMDSRFGLSVIHNLIPRGWPLLALNEVSNSRGATSAAGVWRAYEWVKTTDVARTEFWGYWKNSQFLNTGNPQLVGSFYVRRGERVLLGVLNMSRKSIDQNIKIDLTKLGFATKVFARDANTFDEVAVANDSLTLMFSPEGYRLIELSDKPIDPFVPEKIGENLVAEVSPATWDAKAIVAGWYQHQPDSALQAQGDELVIENSESGTMDWRKILNSATKGQSFLLEAEVRLDCDNEFMNEDPSVGAFKIAIGEVYFKHSRSLSAQTMTGRFEKIRLWFTMRDEPPKVQMTMQGKGKVTIRNLAVYQIKEAPLRPGFAP